MSTSFTASIETSQLIFYQFFFFFLLCRAILLTLSFQFELNSTFFYACRKARIRILDFYESIYSYSLLTLQADHKLSYALMHCNPQSETNIRSDSRVLGSIYSASSK